MQVGDCGLAKPPSRQAARQLNAKPQRRRDAKECQTRRVEFPEVNETANLSSASWRLCVLAVNECGENSPIAASPSRASRVGVRPAGNGHHLVCKLQLTALN